MNSLPEIKSALSILVFLLVLSFAVILRTDSCFAQEKIELKNAKELSGSMVDGQSIRGAKGDVEFIQGNVKVYCNSATQYLTTNRIELIGNVKIYQDTLALFTEKATYYGDEKRAVCNGSVTLKDPNATLRSDNGVYTFNDAKAFFKGDVIIVNPGYRITSDELIYFRNTEESYATGNVVVTTDSAVIRAEKIDFIKREGRTFALGNVKIESDSTIILADTATDYSEERKSVAVGNVSINSINNNTIAYADRLENFEREKFTKLTGNSFLIQIEDNKDTMMISCDTMFAIRTYPESYVALSNVEIIRGKFFSKCGQAKYFKEIETISLNKVPVVWQDNLQLTGDSIYAELPGKKLQSIYAKRNTGAQNSSVSFAISRNADSAFSKRLDQISGADISIRFNDDKIKTIDVSGNARSIYFMYDLGRANGLNRIEGNELFIYFDVEEKVSKIKVLSDPKGEYVPEGLINTVNQTLPGFNIREDKPVRKMRNNM
jgi:lipopolysaccharide export system protein LptA